jgi:hypothetical protein
LAQVQFWAPRVAAYMNQQAVGLIQANRLNEHTATRILALANMAAFDANIACWDAKFTYFLIRPSQADPAITLPIGLPNHPSYTSGHSCNTASYAAVLAHFFPRDAARLQAMVVKGWAFPAVRRDSLPVRLRGGSGVGPQVWLPTP